VSHKTYTTEALICGSVVSNTSDKWYLLFSREAGMVSATARSVREEKSKQRYALQDFSYIRVSLIKGKSGWRIGSAEALGNPFMQVESRRERGLINFVVAQLRRYVHGEIPLERIYDDAFLLLTETKTFEAQSILAQQLFLVRLLSELGYIAPTASWVTVVDAPSISEALSAYTETMEKDITKAIVTATEASHL
jgi:recombinational DNA repair protein (RecF pathway)